MRIVSAALAAALLSATASAQTPPPPAKRLPPAGITVPADARAELSAGAAALRAELDAAARELAGSASHLAALLPDAEVFHKAVDWALRFDEFLDAKHVAVARRALVTGRGRVADLRAGRAPWLDATGLIVRGHRSALDGSVQPYGLVVPEGTRRDQPARLMVWLLGRGEKRNELAFIAEREAGPPQLTPSGVVTLIPYGRFCNATKFAGEIDVFEAMAAARGTYAIDDHRILVAGFSMGGASAWHLATHHAGLWAAAAPGAGFVEVARYTKAFAPGKEPPEWWEQKLWGWYNATDYARNLFNCPTIAYSGDEDPQKAAADFMVEAAAAEGLEIPHLVGPKTGHKYHPDTRRELTDRLEALLARGRDPLPRELRLTTRTLRYPGASWLRFEGLARHWERSDLTATRDESGVVTVTTANVTAVRLLLPGARRVTIDGHALELPSGAPADAVLRREGAAWTLGAAAGLRKRPGLTGPVNDAFMAPFVFVRPTGKPLNATVGAWATAELAHATKMWRDIFRGEAPVKDDTAVSEEDIAGRNLILWGDPASNRLLARILSGLPLRWDARALEFRGRSHDAAHHAPVLIFPNPLNPARYVVLNSGIDLREHAYGTNALQIPKLPDHAVIDLREAPGARWPGRIVEAGFFDEAWR